MTLEWCRSSTLTKPASHYEISRPAYPEHPERDGATSPPPRFVSYDRRTLPAGPPLTERPSAEPVNRRDADPLGTHSRSLHDLGELALG